MTAKEHSSVDHLLKLFPVSKTQGNENPLSIVIQSSASEGNCVVTLLSQGPIFQLRNLCNIVFLDLRSVLITSSKVYKHIIK